MPGTAFGGVGTEHLRISYANSRENLTEALDRIGRFVRGPRGWLTDRGSSSLGASPTRGLRPSAHACAIDLWDDEMPPPRDELLRRVAGVDGVLTLLTDRVDDAFLDAAGPGLRVVSNYAVGFDNIDVAACARRGVAVGNTPGVLTETTADLAWALLHGGGAPGAGGRPLRARRLVADVGPAAPAGAGRPRRDARDRRVRADRAGGRAPGAGLRDGDPVPRPQPVAPAR